MKQLFLNTAKFFIAVIGLGWGAHIYFVESIQAKIDEKALVIDKIRDVDMEHINKRFDRLENLIELILRRRNNE